MGIFFKSNRKSKNTSDNNITINTKTDVLYNIGLELGEIKSIIADGKEKIVNLEERLRKVERLVYKRK